VISATPRLRLNDTLSNSLIPVRSPDSSSVNIYTCGPTVYRDAHIGNMRSYLLADWIKRILISQGHKVTHVKNITDVGHMRQEMLERGDDKVVAEALSQGKSPAEIADFYTGRFLSDERSINILAADVFPKATDHIAEMIEIIESLLEQGFAYAVNGNVYYSVKSFPGYGMLSGNVQESLLREAVRVEVDSLKRDPRDFTLWKSAEAGRELKWDSPWGEGFPGWHIECSAMSLRHLGSNIDIHTGGVDNIFPHHEGEIAQSEGHLGDKVVNCWVHGQHLLSDGVKMSKSSGNSYTIRDIANRGIDPIAFRYLCATVKYKNRMNFTFTALKSSETALNRLRRITILIKRDAGLGDIVDRDSVDHWRNLFMQTISNDLDMPNALSMVWALVRSDIDSASKYELLGSFDQVLGFGLMEIPDMFEVPEHVFSKLKEREGLRENRNYDQADAIRSDLLNDGFLVSDTKKGAVSRTKNASELRNDKWQTISASSEVSSAILEENIYDFTIGIVLTGYPEDASRCIRSLLQWTSQGTFEVIAIDNGSVDGTGEVLEELSSNYDNLEVLHTDHVLGDAAAKNILIKKARGDIYVQLDPSVEIHGVFLGRIREMLCDAEVGIVGLAGLRSHDLMHFHDGEGESGDMDAMQAYCLAFRRSDIRVIGLMRETFRFYRNLDIDFSFQFKDKGYRIIADATLPMTLHEHRAWNILSEGEREELSRKNFGRFLKKWRGRRDLLVSHK